jgi:RNA polymerase sigma factor (sigma-70 family)
MHDIDGRDPQENKVWKDLDHRFRAPLTAYFQRRVNDRGAAEDLTQEVFARLSRRPDQNNGQTLEAYVFKIASSVLVDWGRNRTSRRIGMHRNIADITESATIPGALVEERTPHRVLEGKEALQDIQRALSQLSKQTREIFMLSRMEQVPHREVAQKYGISVSAVEKHIIKAIAHLSARAFL